MPRGRIRSPDFPAFPPQAAPFYIPNLARDLLPQSSRTRRLGRHAKRKLRRVEMLLNRTFVPFLDTRRPLSRVFDLLDGLEQRRPFPAVNLWEDKDALHLETELPGFTMEDIDLSI